MKTINDILSEREIEKYEEGWRNFEGKYRVNSPRNVHSGMPVISEVYSFENYPIFRAHIFNRRLRKFDPYFITTKESRGYIHPFWHAQHYFMVMEQMYHASRRRLKGNSEHDKEIAKDIPQEFKWRKPIFWGDNISIELIIERKGQIRSYDREIGHFTIYSDKTNERLSYMSVLTFWQPRSYIRDIERIRQGDSSAVDDLIRKIEAQAINHRRLGTPRTTLKVTGNDLVEALRKGYVPEEELNDFFSFWDKEPEPK
jgi:hypothetical protein